MHDFLKAIGFSEVTSRAEEERLINFVMEHGAERHVTKLSDTRSTVELFMEVAENAGIVVRGEYDEEGRFHVEHYFPTYRGQNVSSCETVLINKRVDTDAYTGMCDDCRLGVPLIFYLQNKIDLINKSRNRGDRTKYSIYLSALAEEGTILFPIQKSKREAEMVKANLKSRNALIAEAKKGNQEAAESLTLDDIDQYALVSKRIRKEDIYSIVETCFIPFGTESDNYTVLGYITEVKELCNSCTNEKFYCLGIRCNDLEFAVCVNDENLIGEPLPGRRFRGNVWMQGKVDWL